MAALQLRFHNPDCKQMCLSGILVFSYHLNSTQKIFLVLNSSFPSGLEQGLVRNHSCENLDVNGVSFS